MKIKTGRPRHYDVSPSPGMKNARVAEYVSVLEELHERVFDQIIDLDGNMLNAAPGGITITIGRLGLHLASAEAGWMRRLGGDSIGSELFESLSPGRLENFQSAPPPVRSPRIIIDLMDRVWKEITLPVCSSITDIKQPARHESVNNAEKVFLHLMWHWTYHSGQIGLLALQAGRDYTWTFA